VTTYVKLKTILLASFEVDVLVQGFLVVASQIDGWVRGRKWRFEKEAIITTFSLDPIS
jgi:hypothetical protein